MPLNTGKMSIRLSSILIVICIHFVQGKVFWASTPAANWSNLIREAYPIGNGRLGGILPLLNVSTFSNKIIAMPFGAPGQDKVNLNIDSLWSGGPFMVDVCQKPSILSSILFSHRRKELHRGKSTY